MTSKRIAQSDRQQKSEKPQGSGILQHATVRSVSDAGMESTDDKQALALSNSAFSKDFSQVRNGTTKPQQFHARNLQSHPMPPIQAKLTIGEPNDRYEQEADRVASEVVRRINAPASAGRSVQRQEEAEEEIQAKPEITSLQRRSKPEAELQAKLTLQRREAIAGGKASPDLESTINLARGRGQPLDAGLQQSMGQTMGADFSGVRVHTDTQSNQLNQSIQAKAFTTGQDVFFRQGEYNPESRSGQALIAHELTHVVQQKQGRVQPTSSVNEANVNNNPSLEKEADVMGSKAAQTQFIQPKSKKATSLGIVQNLPIIQRVLVENTGQPMHPRQIDELRVSYPDDAIRINDAENSIDSFTVRISRSGLIIKSYAPPSRGGFHYSLPNDFTTTSSSNQTNRQAAHSLGMSMNLSRTEFSTHFTKDILSSKYGSQYAGSGKISSGMSLSTAGLDRTHHLSDSSIRIIVEWLHYNRKWHNFGINWVNNWMIALTGGQGVTSS